MRNEFGMKKTEEMFSVYKMSSTAFFYGTIMALDWQSEEESSGTMEFIKLCQDFMLEKSTSTFLEIYEKYSKINSLFSSWCHERDHDLDYQFKNFQSIINGIYKNEKEEVVDISKFMNIENVTEIKNE